MSAAKIPDGVTLHEIDPAKFYIIDIDSEKIQPWQIGDLQDELKKAGISAGFIIAGKGGNVMTVQEGSPDDLPKN